MQKFLFWLEQTLNVDQTTGSKLLGTIFILAIGWIIYRILQTTIANRITNADLRYQWQKAVGYLFFTAGIFIIGGIWYEGLTTVATFLGLVSAGIAIALRDPIVNFAGWLFILWRKPFSVGDRVQVSEYAGDVIDQRIFVFTMMEIKNWVEADQTTGRVLYIPNGWVFTQAVANYTHGPRLIWNEIPAVITFESNWSKAKKILQNLADAYHSQENTAVDSEFELATKQFLLKYNKLTPTVYTSVKDHGVQLTIRYLSQPRKRRDSTEYFWEAILNVFAENSDIQLAYPTHRIISNSINHFGQDIS